MTTFAQIYDGQAHNIVVGASFDVAVSEKYAHVWVQNEISAGRPWTPVPDVDANGEPIAHGATYSGGDWTNPSPPKPQPNNPGNPYFGKRPLPTKDFWALVGQALPAARFKRLVNDSHFLWVDKVLDKVDTVDVDDKAGQFLQIVSYLTSTDADDGQKMMTAQEVQIIMAAWK